MQPNPPTGLVPGWDAYASSTATASISPPRGVDRLLHQAHVMTEGDSYPHKKPPPARE